MGSPLTAGGVEIVIRQWNGRKCLFSRRRNRDGAEVEALLMDCIVTLLAYDPAGERYLLSFSGGGEGGGGETKRILTAQELSSPVAMREQIRPYVFLGGQTEMEYLLLFWRALGGRHKLVYLESHIGRYVDDITDFWVMADGVQFVRGRKAADGAYKDWLEVNLPDEIIKRIEDKAVMGVEPTGAEDLKLEFPTTGARCLDFIVGDNWYYVDSRKRYPDLELMTSPAKHTMYDAEVDGEEGLIKSWGRLYGNPYMVYLLLGWFCACMYMEEVEEMRGSRKFPLFALSGLTQSGKTSLIALLMRFWGVQARPSDYTQVSVFAELKQLGMVHNAPIWRDEYRNYGRAMEKETMLRSLYDRSAVYRGTASQELREYNMGGTIILSGEGVTLDPAIRRRFIYWELQDRFKLGAREWEEAERWADEFAPILFEKALENGFNKPVFAKLWADDGKRSFATVNDPREERLCIAALGAVFGEELGEGILEMGYKFWERERLNFDGIDKLKMTITEKFFTFVDSIFTIQGGYTVKEFMGSYVAPAGLNYFAMGRDKLFIKIVPLIQFAFDKGFSKQTTLDAYAIKSAVKTIYEGTETVVRIGGVSSRVVGIPYTNIASDTALYIINDNIKRIVTAVRSNGRTIADEEALLEEIEVEEEAATPNTEMATDVFGLLAEAKKTTSEKRNL